MPIFPIPLSFLDPIFSCDRVCDEVSVLYLISGGGVYDCLELQGILSDFSCLIVDNGIDVGQSHDIMANAD